MPLVFPVILLLILGALTMVSRSTNTFLAASKQSDAQAARQAAESGLNRVLRVLSPFGKNATDPYMSFLLLSVWTEGSGWELTKLGRTAVEDRLRRCRISTRGMQPTQLVPNNTADYDRLMKDVIGTTADGKRTLSYRIVSYTPPERAETPGNPPDKPWPSSECGDFQTVSGGTASITIEGSVELNGNRLATQRLTRTIEVDTVPFPNLPLNVQAPTPPISLRISETGEGLGEVTGYVYKELTRDPTPALLDGTFGQLRPQCKNCSPALTNGISKLVVPPDDEKEDVDLPEFPVPSPTPTYLDLALPSGPTSYVIDEYSIGKAGINCSFTRKETEISCYINNITVTVDPSKTLVSPHSPAVGKLRVDTSRYPVNLYIYGNVGGFTNQAPPFDLRPTNQDPGSSPQPTVLPLNDGRVVIEHCVKNCTSGTPEFYRHDDSSNNYNVRPLWSRFRIFGDPEPSSEQNFYIASRYPGSSGPTSLHGVFLWLPKGNLTYGLPTYTYDIDPDDPKSKIWSLSPESSPGELLATWWIQNLNFQNLKGKLNFILPLYGNPEAMSSILPGSFTATNGIQEDDPRFPVYPVLPRPRSTF